MKRKLKCSICGDAIEPEATGWDQGHNAQPVNDGRCCSWCNGTVVIPQRIEEFHVASKLAKRG